MSTPEMVGAFREKHTKIGTKRDGFISRKEAKGGFLFINCLKNVIQTGKRGS